MIKLLHDTFSTINLIISKKREKIFYLVIAFFIIKRIDPIKRPISLMELSKNLSVCHRKHESKEKILGISHSYSLLCRKHCENCKVK